VEQQNDQTLSDRAWHEAVRFLADWLPPEVKQVYRELVRSDPEGWSRHPHFADGIIVRHALRGNGITEHALGVADLNTVWPAILRSALDLSDQ